MPIQLILNLFMKKLNKLKEEILTIKLFLIIIGIIINQFIDKSSFYIWLKEEFSQMKGIKLYSIFKIVEYILLLTNKFGYDMDIQIFKIIDEKKIKHKFFSFIILILFIFLNLFTFDIYYYCTWLILNDIDKNFFLIYLKVNFIEFKQANKGFKSIHTFLMNDVFDRFLNFFIIIFIFINGIIENKIKIDFNNIYFKRICLYFISELISDYLKGIITFKINNLNPKNIKLFLKEEIELYDEIYSYKNSFDNDNHIYNFLKDVKYYKSLISFINKGSLICIIFNINIYPFIILFIEQVFLKYNILSKYSIIKFILLILIKLIIVILIKRFNIKSKSNIPKGESEDVKRDKIKSY